MKRPKSLNSIFKNYDADAENAISLIPVTGGNVKALMMAKQTVKCACFLMNHATEGWTVFMTAFTYDLNEVSEALINAKTRGAKVTLIVDEHSAKEGHTRFMKDQLARVIDGNVEVLFQRGGNLKEEYRKVGRGVNVKGHVHATFCAVFGPTEKYLIVGSTNWTTSSKGNYEMNVLLELSEGGLLEMRGLMRFFRENAKPHDETKVFEQDASPSVTGSQMSR